VILVIIIRQQTESVGDFIRAGPCNRAFLMHLNLLFMQEKAQTQKSA
jgi:hypothetical protein